MAKQIDFSSDSRDAQPGAAAAHKQVVTMVKKRLASGADCAKCEQAEEMLKRRQLWDRIDRVVWADESDPNSEGMVLAERYDIALAPFFLIEEGESQTTQVVTSALQLVKKLAAPSGTSSGVSAADRDSGGERRETPRLTREQVLAAAEQLADAEPSEILDWALGQLGRSCAIAFSGAEDVVLIDMAVATGKPFSVFCLDTGRLHAETYRFIDRVKKHYGIEIDIMFPDPAQLEPLIRRKGLFSFYDDGHAECCGVRKVEPLRRALRALEGWATGQRRDQSPTRTEVPAVIWDESHKAQGMLKINPLARWTQQQVWQYIREHGVPYNELHDRGYISIGCEPCTRPIRPGEHERAGRWWWEEATQRECGLHKAPDKS